MRYLPASNVQSLFHGKGMRLLVVEAVPVGHHHHVGAAPGLADRAHDEHTLEAVVRRERSHQRLPLRRRHADPA